MPRIIGINMDKTQKICLTLTIIIAIGMQVLAHYWPEFAQAIKLF